MGLSLQKPSMERIYSSASRIVFILIALTACGAFLFNKLDTANFMILANAAFLYYFTRKSKTQE